MATPIARHRRTLPSRAVGGFKEEETLSRRRHQNGELLKLRNGWSCRLYEDYRDANGVRQRRRVQRYLGDFKKLPTLRAAQNAMDAEVALVNDYSRQPKTTITFRQQAARWMADCKKRSWKAVKPGVIEKREYALRHVLPLLGDLPLSDVKNGALRRLVEELSAKGLKPSTAQASVQVVKAVVGSAEDADGNLLYAVTWNRKLTPTINPEMQNRPTFTTEELQRLVNATKGKFQMSIILLASTGLRIGEALGLECRHFDGSAIRIEQASWRGVIQTPKTSNAYRTVDLHPPVAKLLGEFIGGRKSGFIFETRNGHPIGTRNFLRLLYVSLEGLGLKQRGFHALRRFRNSFLRTRSCPPGLLRYWMGHSSHSMSDVYDRSFEDAAFRRDVANAVGVGFEVPEKLNVKGHVTRPEQQERALSGVGPKSEAGVSY